MNKLLQLTWQTFRFLLFGLGGLAIMLVAATDVCAYFNIPRISHMPIWQSVLLIITGALFSSFGVGRFRQWKYLFPLLVIPFGLIVTLLSGDIMPEIFLFPALFIKIGPAVVIGTLAILALSYIKSHDKKNTEAFRSDPEIGNKLEGRFCNHGVRINGQAIVCIPAALPPKRKKMKQERFPPGWDEQRVREILDHYETQPEIEAVAEDEAAFEDSSQTVMEIPNRLVPKVRELLAAQAS